MKKYITLITGFVLFTVCYLHNRRQQQYIATQQNSLEPAYAASPVAIPKETKSTLAFLFINPS
jgi:hypothetical protein